MTQITIPDNVCMTDITVALRRIGLNQTGRFPPTFDWEPEPAAEQCAHVGCKRDGTIRWDDDGAAWCGEHAWPKREQCA
jgi:hypothetical protein